MDDREKKIISAVDSLADDIIGFTRRLVAEKSVLGAEASVVDVMEQELSGLGLAPRRIPIVPDKLRECPGFAPVPWTYDEGRENLVAVRPADAEGGKSALFNGHLDVVSPEPVEFWDRDPFDPVIKDGWLYGRGSGDMKSGVAAMTYAVRAVDRAGFGLKAPVTVNAVIEEECCGNGALASVLDGCDAEAVLIPEPFGPVIYAAQVGVLWFKVKVKGVPVHVQAAPAGTNAIEKSYLLISALRRLEEELNQADRPAEYRGLNHPLNLNIGIFNGGDWPSTVPAIAEFHGRLSFFPGMSYQDVRRRIETTLAEAAKGDDWLAVNPPRLDFYGFRSEGHAIDLDHPVFKELSGCHESLTGQKAATYISTCTTDLRAFHFYGRGHGTCFGPTAENIHGANERVNIESVLHTARAYAFFWPGGADWRNRGTDVLF